MVNWLLLLNKYHLKATGKGLKSLSRLKFLEGIVVQVNDVKSELCRRRGVMVKSDLIPQPFLLFYIYKYSFCYPGFNSRHQNFLCVCFFERITT